MKKETALIVLALVVGVVGGLWWYLAGSGVSTSQEASELEAQEQGPSGGTGSPAGSGSEGEGTSQGVRMYSSTAHDFSFEYPASMTLETEGLPAGEFEGVEARGVVAVYSRIDTVVGRLMVNVSSNPGDLGECTEAPEEAELSHADIDGARFLKYQTEGAIGSQSVVSTVYRLARDKTCLEIRDTITSSLPDRLPLADIRQQEANAAALSALSQSIIASFRFTD